MQPTNPEQLIDVVFWTATKTLQISFSKICRIQVNSEDKTNPVFKGVAIRVVGKFIENANKLRIILVFLIRVVICCIIIPPCEIN